MIHRALLHITRASARTSRFAFSQQLKSPPDNQPKSETKSQQNKEETKPQQNKEEPKPQQKKEGPWREDGESTQQQDQPFQKQNRNTVGWMVYRLLFWGTFSALSYNIYLVANHKKKTPVEEETGAVPFVIDAAKHIVSQAHHFIEFITQPPSKKLLPDTIHPDLHPKTLVVNLTGTIIKTEYIFGKGQKITLRPGLQKMLKRLSNKYQIVVFAQQDEPMLMGPIMKIDPKMQYFRGVLGRQSMVWKEGQFIKDLRYLNRDLKKVVALDSHAKNLKNQPKNAIIISEFQGDQKDNELQKVGLLLQRLANVPDVRKFLESLGDNPVQIYYKRMMEAQQKINKKVGFLGGMAKSSKKDSKPKAEAENY